MKKIISLLLSMLFIGLCYVNVCAAEDQDESVKIDLNKIDQNQIDELVNGILKKSKVTGASVVLINGDQTKYLSYGYANKEQKTDVTPDIVFELGSMSKAFTGLGILLLEDEGKLFLDDPITKYISWLTFQYQGTHDGKKVDGDVELTISNFLYQTSGIPFKSIGDIPQGIADSSLEETVRTLIGTKLDFYPGDRHQYATINYDVLGYIIQLVSGQTYEDFIYEKIIQPLGLNNTYLFQSEAQATGYLAQGYKMNFLQAKPYDAPRYRGNTPAGYIFSNVKDMERWIRIQMGFIEVPEQYKRIIERSHIGDITVASQENQYYAAGWSINIKGENIQHGGSNPNYSSMLIMQTEEGLGACILTNMNSNAAGYLASNILNIIQEKEIAKYTSDSYKSLDTTFSIVIIVSILFGFLFLVLLFTAVADLLKKKRIREKLKGAKVAGILLAIPLMTFLGFCIYYLPNILLQRLTWDAVNVWGSPSIMIGCLYSFIAFNIFMIYVLLSFNFPKEKGMSH